MSGSCCWRRARSTGAGAIDMPSGMGRLLSSDRFNWAYVSEPEPYLDNRRLSHPRGRVLGGSSSINGMMYVRGHARDYDGWAQPGCRGWSYAELLPYFRRAEHHQKGASDYHGGDGPLSVSSPAIERSPLAEAFIRAGQSRPDIPIRPTPMASSRRASARWTARPATAGAGAWRAAIWPGRDAPEPDDRDRRAGACASASRAGARSAWPMSAAGQQRKRGPSARSSSAAARSTARSFCSSPASARPIICAKLGIEVRHDLPGVGANLNDHPDIVIQHRCKQPVSLYPATRAPGKWLVGLQWFLTHDGARREQSFRGRRLHPQPRRHRASRSAAHLHAAGGQARHGRERARPCLPGASST